MQFNEVRVKKLAESDFAEIYEGVSSNFYVVKPRPLSKEEEKFATLLERLIQRKGSFSDISSFEVPDGFEDRFRDEIVAVCEINGLSDTIPPRSVFVALLDSLIRLVAKVSFVKNKSLFAEIVLHNAVGLKSLYFFSLDDELEELMINSPESIFVYHKKFGMCKATVAIEDKSLDVLLRKIAVSSGKTFGPHYPLLDARLPDGSRVNATALDVSPRGVSVTIRKFAPTPLTILDLIGSNMLSFELASFLWVAVDGFGVFPKNVLIVGSTASGKTTLLNVLANFSRLHERIVTIEDTLELSLLARDNWVPLEVKHSLDDEITMDQLLKNSLRMRPDRIIVGEVRGEEARTMFTAMDNGHAGCLGTIHANNSREAVMKLQEKPFSVPQSMLPLADLIVVLSRKYQKDGSLRRTVIEVAEVSRMDNKVLLANLYDLDEFSQNLKRTDIPSHLIEVLANQVGISKVEVKKEIETRALILEWMMEKKLTAPLEVLEVIQTYYYNPKSVLSMIHSREEKK